MAVLGATFAEGLSGIHSPSDIVSAAGSFFAAYLLSDLGTGIYHWGVDNYGGPDTPVFGRQIAAFQGHHHRPWTITEREFCNNVHQVRRAAVRRSTAVRQYSHVGISAACAWAWHAIPRGIEWCSDDTD